MSEIIMADANPTKDFFIFMITRDISINAAIVELIDNAIDGAKRKRIDGDYTGLNINISFDKNTFSIKDNCGGFDIETARSYAFKFGRPSEKKTNDGLYTGLFGIGMKRALFKIGRKFTIVSTTKKEHFKIVVDVDEWIKNSEWSFPMTEVVQDGNYSDEECGTEIIIEKLHSEQAINFSNKVFENRLFTYVENFRTIEAENGLKIYINHNEVSIFKERLIQNENIHCYKNYFKIDETEIRVIAGISHNGQPEKAGWYIFCNGRLVLYADKTNITGWGTNYRLYHPSLASFRGYVYFESKDLFSLPWNTTKTGVDTNNKAYIIAMDMMKEAVEQVGKNVSSIKEDYDVNNIDEIEEIQNATEVVLAQSSVRAITTSQDFTIKKVEPKEKLVNISFKEPEEKFKIAYDYAKVKSRKEFGHKLFEYYYEMEEL